EAGRAPAEHLRGRAELDVDLHADDRLVAGQHVFDAGQDGAHPGKPSRPVRPGVGGGHRAGGVSLPTADSSAAATRYIRSSAIVGAITCRRTGSPSDSPQVTELAGPPYMLAGTV